MIALAITGIKVGRPDSYDHRLYKFNAEWIDVTNVGDQPISFDLYLRIKTSTSLNGAEFELRAEDPRTGKLLELAPQAGFRLLSGDRDTRTQNLPEGFQAYFLDAGRFVLHPAGELIAIFRSRADCLHNRLPLAQIVYGDSDRTAKVESQLRRGSIWDSLSIPA